MSTRRRIVIAGVLLSALAIVGIAVVVKSDRSSFVADGAMRVRLGGPNGGSAVPLGFANDTCRLFISMYPVGAGALGGTMVDACADTSGDRTLGRVELAPRHRLPPSHKGVTARVTFMGVPYSRPYLASEGLINWPGIHWEARYCGVERVTVQEAGKERLLLTRVVWNITEGQRAEAFVAPAHHVGLIWRGLYSTELWLWPLRPKGA